METPKEYNKIMKKQQQIQQSTRLPNKEVLIKNYNQTVQKPFTEKQQMSGVTSSFLFDPFTSLKTCDLES